MLRYVKPFWLRPRIGDFLIDDLLDFGEFLEHFRDHSVYLGVVGVVALELRESLHAQAQVGGYT